MNEEVDLVVRCELDGVMNYKGQDQLLSIKALNEFDPKLTGVHLLLQIPCVFLANVGNSGTHLCLLLDCMHLALFCWKPCK